MGGGRRGYRFPAPSRSGWSLAAFYWWSALSGRRPLQSILKELDESAQVLSAVGSAAGVPSCLILNRLSGWASRLFLLLRHWTA